MNALPKYLAAVHTAKGAEILTGVKVVSVAHMAASWVVTADDGRVWHSRSLILTPPAPQSLNLLDAGGVELPRMNARALAAITYAPCLCAMLLVEGSVWLPAPGAVQRPHDEIAWIADNQRKGISPAATVLTLHGSPGWSATHYDDADSELISAFRAALEPWLEPQMGGSDRLACRRNQALALRPAHHPPP